MSNPNYVRMPWGKYKGRPVADLPGSYLAWELEECDKVPTYLTAPVSGQEASVRRPRSRLRRRAVRPLTVETFHLGLNRFKTADGSKAPRKD